MSWIDIRTNPPDPENEDIFWLVEDYEYKTEVVLAVFIDGNLLCTSDIYASELYEIMGTPTHWRPFEMPKAPYSRSMKNVIPIDEGVRRK